MPKILVIEDSFLLLDLITELLVINDFTAVSATSYEEGYHLLQIEKPDLVLCNYPLTYSQGLNSLHKICTEVAMQNISLLFMFSYPPASFIESSLIQEQKNFLVKPFSSIILLEKIQSLLKIMPYLKINF